MWQHRREEKEPTAAKGLSMFPVIHLSKLVQNDDSTAWAKASTYGKLALRRCGGQDQSSNPVETGGPANLGLGK
jgi:hypothetical protein